MVEFVQLLERGIPTKEQLANSFREILEILKSFQAIEIKKNKYFLKEKFKIGRVELTKAGYGFVSAFVDSSRDWLVEKSLLKDAQKGDIVLAKMLAKHRHNGKIKAKILAILQEKNSNILCYLEKYKLDCIAVSIPNEVVYKINASQKSLKTLPPKTLLKINPRNGEILEILGTLEDARIDEVISLNLFNKHESFSLQAELQAQSFKEVRLRDFKERANLTHLPFCAIDPKSAKDHDDAIFYDEKASMLYVAIADVSHYVTPNSPLDMEAKSRGFSIYFPHKSIPMLPRILSENLCSLQENKIRLAMVWKIRLHKRTKAVLNSELFSALVKVKQKLNYEEVDVLLESKKSKTIKKSLYPMLFALQELTQKLRKKRLQKGFDFLGDEVELELDKNLELKSLHFEPQTLSHQLVEECMLLANIQSAKLLEQKNSKNDENLKLGIYRVHPKPKLEKLRELFEDLRMLGVWQGKAIPKTQESLHKEILEIQNNAKKAKMQREVDKLIIKSMQQANYASHNIGHFGLGFESYSHFTSPIRRYSDLVLHRILKSKITLQEDIDKESLPMLCDTVNTQEREIMQIEWDFKDRKFARYLLKHIGQTYQGSIINEKQPILIGLSDYPLMGARVIGLNGSGVKYQRVRVQILEVNLATAKIYGKVLEIFGDDFREKQYKKERKNREIARQKAYKMTEKIKKIHKKHKKRKY